MTGARVRRTREEYVLLALAGCAAAVAVATALREVPSQPAVWAATSVALALSLSLACIFWFAGAARRILVETACREDDAVRRVLSAIPDALLLVEDGRVLSVNRAFCELLGFKRDTIVGALTPFPFWPPEHRYEIERWQAQLAERGTHTAQLTFLRRDGERVPVLVAASAAGVTGEKRYVLTVRDVSQSHRRERRLSELSLRDPETALLNERGFDERLRDAVRRAIANDARVSVVVAELGNGARSWNANLGSPDAVLVIEQLQAALRADDELARTRDDELAWILADTDAEGAIAAANRARRAIADSGAALTAGVCDLATAGDAPSLYALAERALGEARRQGRGTTASYARMRAEVGVPGARSR